MLTSDNSDKKPTFDIEFARRLVRHYPISVSRYGSGQIGFVARPMKKGQRFNKSFSTSVYPTLEEAAQAAIDFCKEIDEAHPSEGAVIEKILKLAEQAAEERIDPVEAFREGLRLHAQRRAEAKFK